MNHRSINLSNDKEWSIYKKVINGNSILSNIIKSYHLEKIIELLHYLNLMICINTLQRLIGKMVENILRYIES